MAVWDISKIGNSPGETTKESTATNVCKIKYCMKGHMASINHIGYNVSIVVKYLCKVKSGILQCIGY